MPTSKQDVSMRDLLASCAAASAVSTPPKVTDTETGAAPVTPDDVPDVRDARTDAPGPAPERRRAA
ncbi:hypothetical protein ACGF5F_03885 [Streptomyces sp. NPDC047821]|uniref:hypothetical protein n=1 Tax=Streptomyces sp. NPDC047821 TaxID=3365488 RepID=UPI003714B739